MNKTSFGPVTLPVRQLHVTGHGGPGRRFVRGHIPLDPGRHLILVLARLKPAGGEALGFGEALWQVTMRTVDTGTVAGDTGWSFRLVGFAITLGGIFIVSALIGVLASGLEGRLNDLHAASRT